MPVNSRFLAVQARVPLVVTHIVHIVAKVSPVLRRGGGIAAFLVTPHVGKVLLHAITVVARVLLILPCIVLVDTGITLVLPRISLILTPIIWRCRLCKSNE